MYESNLKMPLILQGHSKQVPSSSIAGSASNESNIDFE
jgi:hypothetical protein